MSRDCIILYKKGSAAKFSQPPKILASTNIECWYRRNPYLGAPIKFLCFNPKIERYSIMSPMAISSHSKLPGVSV